MSKSQVVLKYYFTLKFPHKRWDELSMWVNLPLRPKIMPFDLVVVVAFYGEKRIVAVDSIVQVKRH